MKLNTFTGTLTTVLKTFGIRTAVSLIGHCISTKPNIFILLFSLAATPCLFGDPDQSSITAYDRLSIGQIQGPGDVSPWRGEFVHFQGVVTGLQEDENERGARFYSVFVQDTPAHQDGDPRTSDGIAVFIGPEKPAIAVGDILDVRGSVIEYYDLTEIDFRSLSWQVLRHNAPLPPVISLEPPSDNQAASDYFEPLEGMRVTVREGVVVGPTHEACGFAVISSDAYSGRIIQHTTDDAVGSVINVMHHTDVSCDDFPLVNVGDEILGIAGPLTYHFGRYRVINQEPAELLQRTNPLPVTPQGPLLREGQISVATFNLDDYFDAIIDSGIETEPVLEIDAQKTKQVKVSAVISEVLNCPTLIGIQEVETRHLIEDLAGLLEQVCDFRYEISHLPAPDSRGSDLALMSNPKLITVTGTTQLQTCTMLDTGINDTAIICESGMQPLFSRPPLMVEFEVNRVPLIVVVNHFKSKRGGEGATQLRRLAQADYLTNQLAGVMDNQGVAGAIVVGDFNDYFQSPVMERLTKDRQLVSVLAQLPEIDQYSYIFDGASQLIDWILVSPGLVERIISADILHVNADYQFGYSVNETGREKYIRTSDHDIPIIVLQILEPPKAKNPATRLAPSATEEQMLEKAFPTEYASPVVTNHETIFPVTTPEEASVTPVVPSKPFFARDSSISGSNQTGLLLIIIPIILGAGFAAIWWRRRP